MGYKRYYIYLLSNKRRTVLYTGVSNDLHRRIWQHKQHVIPGFTKKYNCEQLVHFEVFDEVTDAIAARNKSRDGRAPRKMRSLPRRILNGPISLQTGIAKKVRILRRLRGSG